MRAAADSHTGTPYPDHSPGWTPYREAAAGIAAVRVAVAVDIAAVQVAGIVAGPEDLRVLAKVLKARHTNATNEIATGRATLEVKIAQAATVVREQRAASTDRMAPGHIATHNTAAAVALASPLEAEVYIVLRFPQLSLKFSACSNICGLPRALIREWRRTPRRIEAQHIKLCLRRHRFARSIS